MADATLVYDDDCGFCTWWARFVDRRSTLRVVGFADLDPALEARLPAGYRDCSHLVTEEAVYSCGASIEEALARSDVGRGLRPVVDRLRGVGAYRGAREWGYRRVADNRGRLGGLLSATPPAREAESESDAPADDGRQGG